MRGRVGFTQLWENILALWGTDMWFTKEASILHGQFSSLRGVRRQLFCNRAAWRPTSVDVLKHSFHERIFASPCTNLLSCDRRLVMWARISITSGGGWLSILQVRSLKPFWGRMAFNVLPHRLTTTHPTAWQRERAVQIVMKGLTKVKKASLGFRVAKLLFTYCTTPNSTTGHRNTWICVITQVNPVSFHCLLGSRTSDQVTPWSPQTLVRGYSLNHTCSGLWSRCWVYPLTPTTQPVDSTHAPEAKEPLWQPLWRYPRRKRRAPDRFQDSPYYSC